MVSRVAVPSPKVAVGAMPQRLTRTWSRPGVPSACAIRFRRPALPGSAASGALRSAVTRLRSAVPPIRLIESPVCVLPFSPSCMVTPGVLRSASESDVAACC